MDRNGLLLFVTAVTAVSVLYAWSHFIITDFTFAACCFFFHTFIYNLRISIILVITVLELISRGTCKPPQYQYPPESSPSDDCAKITRFEKSLSDAKDETKCMFRVMRANCK